MATQRDWETQFREWAKPPGKTEKERCENAASAVRNAIGASDKLRARQVSVFVQGSYRNNTNVRRESDVDIGILCADTFFLDLPEGTTRETFRIEPATYHYAQYKNEVEEALVNLFGRSAVVRGNKAFDVHENTYRVEADVAPFFEHRRYHANGRYLSGVELRPDNGRPIKVVNWPQQHYENGVSKNNSTSKRYKAMVRVLKSLRNEMADSNYREADPIAGFLVECLVWNVPDDHFGHSTYADDVRACLAYLFNNTRNEGDCSEWGEVSELKYLFRPSQKWTREQANSFLYRAWAYVGFE
jgi:hypothetical protein